jgi:hypothetical protein
MQKTQLLWFVIIAILLSSCTYSRLADYDQKTADKIIEISKLVNQFYLNLSDQPPDARQYHKSAEAYNRIEVEIETLLLMNRMRANNEESIKQTENLLSLWVKYKDKHKEKDDYSDAMIDLNRKLIKRNIVAIATGEQLKQ